MRTAETMQPLVDAYVKSDLSLRAFCESHNINVHTFQYWHTKLNAAAQPAPRAAFIPISIPAPRPAAAGAVRIALPNGVDIHLPAADAAFISELIRLAC